MRVRTRRFIDRLPVLVRVLRSDPELSDRYQSLLRQPRVRHARLGGYRAGEAPVALATAPGHDGRSPMGAQPNELAHASAGSAPLLPVAHPHSAANPTVQNDEVVELASQAEITYPAAKVSSQLGQTSLHGNPTAAAGEIGTP